MTIEVSEGVMDGRLDGRDELTVTPWRGRFLLPTDFSEESEGALTLALELARKLGASVELLHVYALPLYAIPPVTDVVGITAIPPEVVAQIDKELDRLSQRVRASGIDCETTMLVGSAPAVIVARAIESGATMIVMGTHGRSGLKHAVVGSVAEKVVQTASCPVLVVPPPGRTHRPAGPASSR
jgi:nucleotide-binding universal stress UspA family protein